ncbi:hypothetical protein HB779_02120 [Phyllobacterium sp. 628]|uniref:DUF6074 family protein n=1 Tax=Phyllobacterium sp. 628 TaxID=2718938 RepID=UPI0016622AA3|nr:DUF6074 family protein [Phyllobacterium sp. 628]QND50817.1 hypothetical protein HB779_02120 [Phyllobacterium sp. 628]
MSSTDLPLFSWQQPCKLVSFPLNRRVGKVRDVALKLLEKSTDRHAEFYRNQVTDALLRQLERIGVSETDQDEQLGAFWESVREEMLRLTYRGSRPGGAA